MFKTAEAKHVLKRMRYIFSRDSSNLSKIMEFLNAKKKYKRSIKVFKNNLKTSKLYKLATLEPNTKTILETILGWKTMGRANIRPL